MGSHIPQLCSHGILGKQKCKLCHKEWMDRYRRKKGKRVGVHKICCHSLYITKCPICRKVYDKNYRSVNVEKIIKSTKKWRKNHPEQYKEYIKNYHKNNPNYWKIWNIKNPERRKNANKKYQLNHPDRIGRWAKSHPDRVREITRNCNKRLRIKNPDKFRIIDARHACKRRKLGWNPMNDWFKDSNGHHINNDDIVYVPKWLNCFIPHNLNTGYNMALINNLVFEYLELTGQVVWIDQ